MSKRKPKPAAQPTDTVSGMKMTPVGGPVDIAAYAASLPGKRQALVSHLQQLENAKVNAMAQINELGGEATAVAKILGKSIEEVLGLPLTNVAPPRA